MSDKEKAVALEGKSALGVFKWVLIFAILAAGIFLNVLYGGVPTPIRVAIGIVVLVVVLGIAATTALGQKGWSYVKAARNEFRKVTWPTKQEATQMTIIVLVAVVVLALLLWGVDALFLYLVGLLTGQG
jgi:preprotein translocase subunit SecE